MSKCLIDAHFLQIPSLGFRLELVPREVISKLAIRSSRIRIRARKGLFVYEKSLYRLGHFGNNATRPQTLLSDRTYCSLRRYRARGCLSQSDKRLLMPPGALRKRSTTGFIMAIRLVETLTALEHSDPRVRKILQKFPKVLRDELLDALLLERSVTYYINTREA
jgi:hypothetical protein